MSLWIDLDNSPHVPLFVPVIEAYRARGVEVVVTARDHSQTIELLDAAGLNGTYTVIGRHYGKSKLNKIRGLVARTFELRKFVRNRKGDHRIRVAVSHGSRSMVLAARMLGIPVITMYDYEFTETKIFNFFSDKVMIPAQIPESTLHEIGLSPAKRVRYEGIKEELYMRTFRPDSDFRSRLIAQSGLDLSESSILVALRPPATTANYHNATADELFRRLLVFLDVKTMTRTIVMPRTREQFHEIEALVDDLKIDRGRFFVAERAINALDLAVISDVLISGGGTMNREAALLGTPVYSIFAGRQGALDAAMERSGQIRFVRTTDDVVRIDLRKKIVTKTSEITDRVEKAVAEQINCWL